MKIILDQFQITIEPKQADEPGALSQLLAFTGTPEGGALIDKLTAVAMSYVVSKEAPPVVNVVNAEDLQEFYDSNKPPVDTEPEPQETPPDKDETPIH